MRKFKPTEISQMLLVSDIDGTLLAPEGVPERNMQAIRHWMDKGGRFTLATGRGLSSLARVSEVPFNAPAILLNGGAIIDLSTGKALREIFLPPIGTEIVKEIQARFPEIGIGVWADNCFNVVVKSEPLMRHIHREAYRKKLVKIEEVEYNVNKVIFAAEPEIVHNAAVWLEAQRYSEVGFFYSSPDFYEMAPAGVSKGAALPYLAAICGVSLENTLAIGDYFNDLTLLQTAGFSACASEAPEPIRAVADFIAGPCAGGAVADFIEYIERQICAN